jgi:Fe-S-cluster containining protein
MSLARWQRNQDKVVTPPIQIEYPGWSAEINANDGRRWIMEGDVLPITKTLKCCFLNEDLSCNIYDDRPDICKEYGKENDIQLTCAYQNKDGKANSKQVRRMIERKQAKKIDNFMNRFRIL